MHQREFTIANEYHYDRRSAPRWVLSHVLRYPWMPLIFFITAAGMAAAQSLGAVFVGQAFDALIGGGGLAELAVVALWVIAAYLGYGACDIVNSLALRVLGQRVERDTRAELYLSLLGKSQTYLNRQPVGDLMARATYDVQQISLMVAPNSGLIIESFFALVVPIITIAALKADLLLVPLLFLVTFSWAIRRYNNALRPVSGVMNERFGAMNAGLAEAIGGMEVVKGFAQEQPEERRFGEAARAYRDAFVRSGAIQARYLPLLLYGMTVGLAFGHAVWLVLGGQLTVGQAITYMTLMETLQTPTRFSLTTFAAVQLGLTSAARILSVITARTELDENSGGYSAPMRGEIAFEGVSFGYADQRRKTKDESSPEDDAAANKESHSLVLGPSSSVLKDISFHARPGQAVAIVGQTGAGKTTLTKLVNRIYDATDGRVLIDGVDVREWSMDSLRSQIATIEQDIFLFSRTIAENIAFGARTPATREQIEQAARLAQAHDFIMALPAGYETVVGERGVTLSGGQRQRIAIARAFLIDPRILILDDSTSAIDSATEDQIQQAMRQILASRTTLLITHRLAQIRRADWILLLKNGTLIAQGTHEQLLATSPAYRQIFARNEQMVANRQSAVSSLQ
ncbi:MAG TPA: ABC transporter ATP-binding protein [Roseiflexaceae bacterium]|nr:ABC transporter ATP-binding protein [Roseiflexaceae bacterium]